jgi:hypothetical protein
MPAARAKVVTENGLKNLFCMACGAPVYTEAEGHAEHTCEHVRFFIDWDGELSLSDPEDSTGADRGHQQAIVDVVESTNSWDEFLTKVTEALPASVLILEVVDPARSGGKDDARAVIGFDIAQTDVH